ncbi:hypothetical protein BDV06DRAFT_234700 [Aspergillus oleicola]
MAEEESLLTNLCAICHLNPPKYRCPRCSLRSCSLACTKKHKTWSQCSGVRDPGAYVRRAELATESAFDRDFNFITGIERGIERAGRDVENRGVDFSRGVVGLDREGSEGGEGIGGKRKRGNQDIGFGQGLAKGEAGFLRRAQEAGVSVIKAPRGMSRAKMNGSRWLAKQKCLQWTVEFVTDDEMPSTKRANCAEAMTIAECYDRAFPFNKEERELRDQKRSQDKDQSASTKETEAETNEHAHEATQSEPRPEPESNTAQSTTTDKTAQADSTQTREQAPPVSDTDQASSPPISHRNMSFYIHRPRTATKQPVLFPISPNTPLKSALAGRTVLEFPTIYALRVPLTDSSSSSEEGAQSGRKYVLESEYLRMHQGDTLDTAAEADADDDSPGDQDTGDTPDVDEGKVLEVLQKDLFE